MLSQSSKLEEASASILQSSDKANSTKSALTEKPHKRSDSSENDDQNVKALFKGRHSSSPQSGTHSRSNSGGKERKRSSSQTKSSQNSPAVWVSAVPSISKYLRVRRSQSLAKKNGCTVTTTTTPASPPVKAQAGRVPLGESPCFNNADGFDFGGGQEGDMAMDVDRNGIQIPSLPSIAISTMVHMHHRARRDGGGKPLRTPSSDQCQWREIKREEKQTSESLPCVDDAMKE